MDIGKLTPSADLRGDSDEDTQLLRSMLEEAQTFLTSFDWCKRVEASYFGLGVGGVVAVFLFHILPAHSGVDDSLWVVAGDLPAAYLVVDESPDPVNNGNNENQERVSPQVSGEEDSIVALFPRPLLLLGDATKAP